MIVPTAVYLCLCPYKVLIMPAYIKVLTSDGLQAVDYTATSLQEAARFEPEGIYTVTNTYHTFHTLRLDAHLDRLEDSARLENIPLRLDRSRLKAALHQMITEAGYGNVRFRLTIARHQPSQIIISLEPFIPLDPDIIQQGVHCVTAPGIARRNPAAKTSDWAQSRQGFQKPEGIYEVLLVSDQGDILEGFTSNFYAVLNGVLRTAGAGMLPGIAQQIVFLIAPAVIPLRQEAVNVADLTRLEEAFITSSSRGIVPVVSIDGVTPSQGVPGTYTLALRAAYNQWVQAHLEPLQV